MRGTLSIVAACLLFAACSGDTGDSGDPEPWQEAPSYTYTLDSQCGEKFLIGTFEITVLNHTVSEASALDDDAQALADLTELEHVPTLQDLYDEYWTARWGDADDAQIEHAPVDGHPLSITIDWDAGAIDDESCYVITDYSRTS